VFASLPRILRTLAHKAVRTDAEPLALRALRFHVLSLYIAAPPPL
jgi:hypothetical protein